MQQAATLPGPDPPCDLTVPDAPRPTPDPISAAPASPEKSGQALARVGLLGNPSDGYGGKVLSFTLLDQAAEVTLSAARPAQVSVSGSGSIEAHSIDDLLPRLSDPSLPPGTGLLVAAWGRFRAAAAERSQELGPRAGDLKISASTSIPRQVGLSGSSALILAALRAFARRFDLELSPFELSELALAAEVEDLGIAAGPQDRVVQAYEGLVYMDFSGARSPSAYTSLEVDLLPPLFLAWTPQVGAPSGVAHAKVRARWERGDADVRRALDVFPRLAEEGLEALAAGDAAHLADLLDRNFAARRSIWPLATSDIQLTTLANELGAGAKLAGSGGAIVGVPRDGAASRLDEIGRAFTAAGFSFLVPHPGCSPPKEASA